MQNQGDKTLKTDTNEKALTIVGAFFSGANLLTITGLVYSMQLMISMTVYFRIIARFKMKIEHENLCRNTTKIDLLYPATDQQLRRVVSKCSIWW